MARRKNGLSYEKLLKFREFFLNLPKEAARDIDRYMAQGSMSDVVNDPALEGEVRRIVLKHGLNEEFTSLYISWYFDDTHYHHHLCRSLSGDRAVLFCDLHELINGRPGFDYRRGLMYLPEGISVIGFITGNRCLIDMEFVSELNNDQMADLMAMIQEALLRRNILDITAGDVVEQVGIRIVGDGFACNISA